MHRTVTALVATAILALSAAPAFAQETSPQTQATQAPVTGQQPPATNPNRTATSGVVPPAGQPTYGELVSALNRTPSTVAQLRAMTNLTTNNVRIVKVQTIVTPDNTAALNANVTRNQAQLATLRRTLANMRLTATTDNSSITLAQFLTDNKLDVNRVVAADVTAGNVVLFIE
jgi:hypothetical protein